MAALLSSDNSFYGLVRTTQIVDPRAPDFYDEASGFASGGDLEDDAAEPLGGGDDDELHVGDD